ncbi:CG14630 [Drosophila busckii]|uniref:CG14630 n=1 Tax=Drosophila busckii TaxID=30019 RepID=A0A0M4ESA1_DROBS|nr:gamma-butyrobetaine dioxygenase [Drosophila busckii]ALC48164.1 CG14630 [Drosophila busckii]
MLSCRRLIGQLANRSQLRCYATARLLDQRYVELTQKNGEQLKYPSVWLRDNCQCPDCFYAATSTRKSNWERGPLNVRAETVRFDVQRQQLIVHWQDAHESSYDLNWLQERDFASRQRYLDAVYKPPMQLWSKTEFAANTCEFAYKDVLKQDAVLLQWLEALAVKGFALLHGAPNDVHVVRQLAERIGYIKHTTYGDVFEVKSKPNAGNYAYLMTPLPLHTDMPYYEYKAGINILHTLVQSESPGGSNTMTDGFYIADKLRREHPAYFELLRSVPVNWFDIGHDGDAKKPFHSLWRAPIICLDVDGQYARINQNTTKRDSRFSVPLEQVVAWYEAYDMFMQLAQAEAVEFKTRPGDVFVFNNLRMLHGRTAYEDSPENKRHLVGAYVDWDIIYSKLRTLKFPNAKD